jgi:hypothetical protein
MSKHLIQRDYGVECKNRECHNRIVLGEYMTPRRSNDEPEDPIPLIRFTARKVTCAKCQKTYRYEHSDLREFPAKLPV